MSASVKLLLDCTYSRDDLNLYGFIMICIHVSCITVDILCKQILENCLKNSWKSWRNPGILLAWVCRHPVFILPLITLFCHCTIWYAWFLRPAQRYEDLTLIEFTCQAVCHFLTEHGIYVKFKKTSKLLSSSLPVSPSRILRAPVHHCTIWCRSNFGPRGPGPSHSTFFLRPALPMAPTRDNSARDERNVHRPNQRHSKEISLFVIPKMTLFHEKCV